MAIDNVKENAKSLITELFPTQFTLIFRQVIRVR
jgi:hypothetical protein